MRARAPCLFVLSLFYSWNAFFTVTALNTGVPQAFSPPVALSALQQFFFQLFVVCGRVRVRGESTLEAPATLAGKAVVVVGRSFHGGLRWCNLPTLYSYVSGFFFSVVKCPFLSILFYQTSFCRAAYKSIHITQHGFSWRLVTPKPSFWSSKTQIKDLSPRPKIFLHGCQVPRLFANHHRLLTLPNSCHLWLLYQRFVHPNRW